MTSKKLSWGIIWLNDYIIISPNKIHNHTCIKNADKAVNQKFRDLHLPHQQKQTERMIKNGVEEYYHCFQFKNPKKWAQLLEALQQVYSMRWEQERERRFKEAAINGLEAQQEFYKNDPLEKDAHLFITAQQGQIKATADRYAASQRGIS